MSQRISHDTSSVDSEFDEMILNPGRGFILNKETYQLTMMQEYEKLVKDEENRQNELTKDEYISEIMAYLHFIDHNRKLTANDIEKLEGMAEKQPRRLTASYYAWDREIDQPNEDPYPNTNCNNTECKNFYCNNAECGKKEWTLTDLKHPITSTDGWPSQIAWIKRNNEMEIERLRNDLEKMQPWNYGHGGANPEFTSVEQIQQKFERTGISHESSC